MFTPDLKEWQEADGTGFWGGQRKMWVLFSGDPWRDQPLQPPAKVPGSGPAPLFATTNDDNNNHGSPCCRWGERELCSSV